MQVGGDMAGTFWWHDVPSIPLEAASSAGGFVERSRWESWETWGELHSPR